MSEALLLSRPQKQAIHIWKKYNVVSTTTYTWNVYNAVTTTTYKWNKYNAVSTTTYTWRKYNYTPGGYKYSLYRESYKSGFLAWNCTLYSSITCDPSSGTIRGSGSTMTLTYQNGKQAIGKYWIPNSQAHQADTEPWRNAQGNCVCTCTVWSSKRSYVEGSIGSYIGTVSSTNSSAYPDDGSSGSYWYESNGSSTSWSKGSTSYGEVTSTSSSAYPSNGASGSYWYESAGSTTSTSKGSTKYSDVSSTNSSAYPNGGASGSYWYDNRTSSVSYSMGSYVGDEVSLDRNAYPADGMSGSYWYVYQGIS